MDDTQKAELLEDVLERTGAVFAAVPEGAGGRPTPCPDFDVAGLQRHIVGWLRGFDDAVVHGRLTIDPSAEPVGPDPTADYRAAAASLLAHWRSGDPEQPVRLVGDDGIPKASAYRMLLGEYIVHGWDLAKAVGAPVTWTDEEAAAALEGMRGMLTADFRGPGGSFGPEVPVPDDAPAVERLVAFAGRDPKWSPAV